MRLGPLGCVTTAPGYQTGTIHRPLKKCVNCEEGLTYVPCRCVIRWALASSSYQKSVPDNQPAKSHPKPVNPWSCWSRWSGLVRSISRVGEDDAFDAMLCCPTNPNQTSTSLLVLPLTKPRWGLCYCATELPANLKCVDVLAQIPNRVGDVKCHFPQYQHDKKTDLTK